jgi:opacity protein-like surface antigen
MKSVRKIMALGALMFATLPVSGLDLSMETRFDSESVSSGSIGSKEKVSLNFEVGDDVCGGKLYAGLDTRYKARGGGSGKTAPYIGYSHVVSDWLSLDGRYQSYFYSNVRNPLAKHHTNELALDMHFGPRMPLGLSMTYNFDEREFGAEADLSGRYSLSCIGMSDFTLVGKAAFGCDRCERPNGVKDFFTEKFVGGMFANDKKACVYYTLKGDCVYAFNDNVDMWVGVRLAGNGASKGNWNNLPGGHQNALWWSCGMKASF